MLIEYDGLNDQRARIKVIGIGGGGGNAVQRMIDENLSGVEFIAVNTDAQALNDNRSENKIQIGSTLTRGLGAGSDDNVGYQAAIESKDRLEEAIQDADLVFITAGMGGGTGTGAAPVIAEIAKNSGALTIGIVTKPFMFEGVKRSRRAEAGISKLRRHVDTMIVIPNEKLMEIADDDTSFENAFKIADSVLNQATTGISDLITKRGMINLDFADVRTVMNQHGPAVIGVSRASGPDKAIKAVENAIHSPLLDNVSIKGSKGLLINFTGGHDLKISEVNKAARMIQDEAGDDANIIFGSLIDDNMENEIQVTVIATGFDSDEPDEVIVNSVPPVATFDDYNTQTDASASQEQINIFNKPGVDTSEDILVFGDGNNGDNSSQDTTIYPFQTDSREEENLDIPAFTRKKSMFFKHK